jgi:hypothetical protein
VLCSQGKQRHIGRYKDETLAAQAYDRAAYYLYGTRANLNFRLVDVLADPNAVPASIKLAKEQPFVGTRLQSQFNANTNTSCGSSSSSTCSYSPHSSRQPQSISMHSSSACGFIQGCVTAGDPLQQQQMGMYTSQQQQQQQVLLCMPQQQQQQMAACMAQQQQLLTQQQAGTISHLPPGWVQQQQQQLVGCTCVSQAYAYTGMMQPAGVLQQQGLHAMQVMPQGVIGVAAAGLPISLQQQQQQQQVATPAASMPDVVTSMIAGLCCDDNHGAPQSTALATSSCSTHATPFGPAVHCSAGQTAGLPAGHAASTVHFPGFLTSSGPAGAASSNSSAGLLAAQSSQQQQQPLGWPISTSTPYQCAPGMQPQLLSSGNDGSMPGQQLMSAQFAAAAGHAGNAPMTVPISAAGQAMPMGYLASTGQTGALQQQQQQAHMLQLQSHSLSGPGFASPHGMQHSAQHGTAGGVYHAQQLAGDVPLQVLLPDGVVLNSSQLNVMPGAWPQQQQVLLS